MSRPLRRLRNLNLGDEENSETVENENIVENENGHDILSEDDNDDNLQGTDDDGLLARLPQHHPRTPIKIIWPNGEVRQVLGDFRVSNLVDIDGGKVIVRTDENGVPNERSASIIGQYLGQIAEKPSLAPLHIERWDNKLFNAHKQQIIKDVEKYFQFPRQMLNLSRDWVLRTVNNRWRSYKSKLKKQYFNPEERSLNEIIKGKPNKVNEVQWKALVGFWCRDQHKKVCATNTRTAKEQKNTHTSGRKSHARLKKEMEDYHKKKVHRLELWEAAHKKKDGRYTTQKVGEIMNASYEELEKRQQDSNGNLSSKDFNEVFNGIVAKELKARGYYEDKYWSDGRVSQGVTFVTETEEERRYRAKVNEMESKMEHRDGLMKQWLDFMFKKFPEENFIKEMIADLNNGEDGNVEPETHADHSPARSFGTVHSPTNEVQGDATLHQETSNEDYTSLPSEQTFAKEAHIQNSTNEGNGNAATNSIQDPILINMRTRRVKPSCLTRPESRQYSVHLLSLRNKGRIVANAKLVTTDANREIGGHKLGKEYVGVYVEGLENVDSRNKGDEQIPRPFRDINTLIDAIGFVIPWPHSHVRRAKSDVTLQGREKRRCVGDVTRQVPAGEVDE